MPFTYAAQVLCVNTTPDKAGGSLTSRCAKTGRMLVLRLRFQLVAPLAHGVMVAIHLPLATIGDKLDLQLVNTYGSPSANIVSITLSMTPTSPATGNAYFRLGVANT